jgi:hypothetical protein
MVGPLGNKQILQRSRDTKDNCRGEGILGEAQKQPGGLPPHCATRVQHSPPVKVRQQHSTSPTRWRPALETPTGNARHKNLPRRREQADGSALAETTVASMKVIAIKRFPAMRRSTPCHPRRELCTESRGKIGRTRVHPFSRERQPDMVSPCNAFGG